MTTTTTGSNGTSSAEVTKHAISLYVANKPGVLIRISLVFARRGYNIDSLVVSEAHDPSFAQMNIEVTGDTANFGQILKQLNKLVDVVHARDNTGSDVIDRELALIKIDCSPELRSEIIQVSHAFESKTVDLGEHAITLEVSGDSRKIDSVHTVFSKYGVIEMVRSGKILIARGEGTTS